MQCSHCHRADTVVPNKFAEESYHKVLHAAKAGQHAGYPVVAFGAMTLAGVMKLTDRFTHDYRCTHCGTKFS
ncbi:hypothetical protein [Sphingopyxis sp. GC21]|uniref:hypothetical protein n=1 Tax=Sphingopyxis sp. GC21 TaxID=2933562 RepID=UPI0021E35E53|nr:hypothetical protein [Sphingopyxis sp. GC21]